MKAPLPALALALMLAVASTAIAAEVDDTCIWKTPSYKSLGYFGNVTLVSLPFSGAVSRPSTTTANISSSTDVDYYLMNCGRSGGLPGTVTVIGIGFKHAVGDLDIEVYDMDGNLLGISQGTTDMENVDVTSAKRSQVIMKVYGYNGATGGYGFWINCS